MKAVLFCICALALCAYVMGDENQTFTPAEISCDAKIFYTEVFDTLDEQGQVNSTRIFTGFLALYGRYLAQHENEKDVDSDVFGIVRLDIPDPKDPNTASLFYGIDRNNTIECMLYSVNPLTDLYKGLGYEIGYFRDEFPYNSTENATFEGVECTAYIFESGDEKKIHYVDDSDLVIGYEYNSTYMHRVWDAKYQYYAEYKDFRMPTKFPGCPDEVYQNVKPEPKCDLTSDSSSTSTSQSSTQSSGASSTQSSGASSTQSSGASSTQSSGASSTQSSGASSHTSHSSGASTVEITFATLFIAISLLLVL